MQTEVVSNANEVSKSNSAKPIKYVVVRDGIRVSDAEYDSMDDPDALAELEFWTKIANKHSHGEPVSIVRYESKKHRIY